MAGHICPECGTDSRPGTGPGCACAPRYATDRERAAEQQRITEAHHAGRSAEMAAAEDFDPLRIRPYVTLGGDTAAAPAPAAPDGAHTPDSAHAPDGSAYPPGTPHTPGTSHDPDSAHRPDGAHDPDSAHGPDGAHDPDSAHGPGTPHGYGPGGPEGDAATTMPLFLGPAPDAKDPAGDAPTGILLAGQDPVSPRRRKPFAALVAGAAVVTVVGTAAFIGGLFNGDDKGEVDLDQALPSTVASLPDESAEPEPSTTSSASAPPSRSPSPSASSSASASAPASPSATASASRSATASATAPGAGAPSSPAAPTESNGPTEGVAPPPEPPGDSSTLRRGDRGPEVAELQNRLREVWVYNGPVDSDYSDRTEQAVRELQSWWNITDDPGGVYGPSTRRALEARTTGQGRR
ncbi:MULTISPECIES: peptidoglycan-binding domain-containing protein [unclassified Streptomyces]|uniref:peptidoglycan-binding domain-containing protein n=1 Tax=unclassified Streptomyces TaxID=2593676 RepID=UPI00035FAE29|nr:MULTISPECIES: peptidoglycan-binding domain-containing protein [unclassified Streptomyces]MYY06648.1 peptidoglycan-binding protein [Streptomyces sp. SID4913]